MENLEDKPTEIKCYECQTVTVLGGTQFFPFCSQECKEKYAAKHFEPSPHKYKTIEECQRRLMEMKPKVKTVEPHTQESLLTAAEIIFGKARN